MSELMDDGIIRMPYEMAMSDELSRKQFYSRANSLLTELTEIRAKLAAMERRKPDMYRKEVHEGWPEWSENDLFSDGESGGEPWYRGSPVPADKPADKRVNRDDLRLDLDRRHLLNEAADRADYFFRQTDGSYKFPSLGGHVSQLIEMLLAAANLPADKPERITEQDALEILSKFDEWDRSKYMQGTHDGWFKAEGHALLNKLNADRQVPADQVPDAIQLLQRVAASTTEKPAVAVPDGFKLVPISCSPEMWDAGSAAHQSPACIYHAMVKAAPPHSQKSDGHDWDDQDKCKKCGDRDWYAGPVCNGKSAQSANRCPSHDSEQGGGE